MAKACIVCYKEVAAGHPVEDDAILRAMRKVKQHFKVAKNNELVVEESCMDGYRKKREKFEKDLVMHVVLAAVVLIVFIVMPIFSGGFSIWVLLAGIMLAAILIGLSVLSYCPKVKGLETRQQKPQAAKLGQKKAKAKK
jgi:hypothetical protein